MALIADSISGLLRLILKYWYIIVMGVMGFFLLKMYLDKVKNKVEYHDQIKENKQLMIKELKFNPTPIKKIQYLEKEFGVYGEIIQGYFKPTKKELKQRIEREFNVREIKQFQWEKVEDDIHAKREPDFIIHTFLVKSKKFWIFGYTGEFDILRVFNNEFHKIKTNTLRVNQDISLLYRDGMIVSYDPRMIKPVADTTERLMGDLKVNAQGQQQKDFSRIRTDYAHTLDMKEKDIEADEKKEQVKKY
jgi:hypothetical protein